MKRLIVGLAPTALMGFSFWVYSDHLNSMDRSLEWRQHTYEARSLAERLVRDAGCPPDAARLPRDVDAFAAATADNPAQVARVAEIRRAMTPMDAAKVARLAEAAIAEEERLIPGRAEAARKRLAEARRLPVVVCLIGLAMGVLQAFFDFLARVTEPKVRHTPATPRAGNRPGGGR